MFYRKFPYTNFHEINLDLIITVVKELSEEWIKTEENITKFYNDTTTALTEFKAYMDNYFNNLDVQNEINNKINTMIQSGQFDAIIKTQLSPVVTNWLDTNITTPEGVVIDKTLTIQGAVADAKAVGDKFKEVEFFDEKLVNDNILFGATEYTEVTALSSWAHGDVKSFDVPSTAKSIYFAWDDVKSSSGTLPNNKILLKFYGESSQIGSNIYITQTGASYNIPIGATRLTLEVYTNNAQAVNTSLTFDNIRVTYNTRFLTMQLTDDVYIDDMDMTEVAKILKDSTEVDVTPSRNIFKATFNQANINAQGVYGRVTTVHNTATDPMVEVEPNTGYTLSWDWNRWVVGLYLHEYDENGNHLGYTTIDNYAKRISYKNFTTRANTKYIRLMFYAPDNTEYAQIGNLNAQITRGGIPYNKINTKTVNNMVDYETVRDPKLVLPNYYFKDNYIQEKVDTIRQLMFDAKGDYDAFVFITDTHWEINAQKSPALIRYLKKALNINKIFHGGDVFDVWSQYWHNDCLDILRNAFEKFPKCVAGNHEYKNQMDDATVWYMLNSTHDNIEVGNPNRNYYYYDNKAQKIRYIMLNMYSDNGNDAVLNFDAQQQEWLINTALDIPEDWNAIIFAHTMYEVSILNYELISIPDITSTINNIIDSHNEDNSKGKIIALIQGHLHIDRITRTPSGVPVIATTCDKNGIWIDPNTGLGDLRYCNRDSGTINEQAFDVYIVDKHNKKISAVRIGAKAFDGVDNNMGNQVEIRSINY